MSEQMAIIKGAGFGMRDFRGEPGLWFTVHLGESGAALQCFFGDDIAKVIKDHNAHDLHDLNDKPCWVEADANKIKYLRAIKIKA